MRYYDVKISNPTTGKLIQPVYFSRLAGFTSSYTSFVNGQTLAGALNIELDIPISTFGTPQQGGWLSIYGVSIQEIQQSQNLVGCTVQLFAGMKKGLPLAKPQQSIDPMMEGVIYQCFGNWIGNNMMLQFVFQPYTGRLDKPLNIVLNWKAQTLMRDAILNALLVAFPDYTITIGISEQLKQSSDQIGPYPTLAIFALEIGNLSRQNQFTSSIKPLGGGAYTGVKMAIKGKTIFVYDGTADVGIGASYGSPKVIAFEDLIGQPTWVLPNVINFKTVMRTDLQVGSYVKLPEQLSLGLAVTLPGAAFPGAAARNQSTFKGVFEIQSLHHMGNFRQSDGNSWVTIANAVFVPEPTKINAFPVNGPSVSLGGSAAP